MNPLPFVVKSALMVKLSVNCEVSLRLI
jgi:hypothetical protein